MRHDHHRLAAGVDVGEVAGEDNLDEFVFRAGDDATVGLVPGERVDARSGLT